MLRLRLQRLGRKKQPVYRLIVSERTKDTQAGSIEILGHYNPLANPKILELNKERIEHWLSVGAQPSNTVNNLLLREGIIKGEKKKSVTITNKRQSALDKKKEEEEQKKRDAEEAKRAAEEKAKADAEAKKAEEAAAKAAAEEKPADETPASEAPSEEEKPQE